MFLKRALFFLTLIAISGGAYLQHAQQPSAASEKADAEQNKEPSTAPVISKPSSPPQTLKQNATDKRNDRNKWRDIVYDPTSIFTGVIAFFTILLVIEAWRRGKGDLRAYVGMENINIEMARDYFLTSITNFGKTPAHNMAVWISLRGKLQDMPEV